MVVRVFLMDDFEPVRTGLRRLIDLADDLSVVGESGKASESLEEIELSTPDVAILDVRLPDGSGIEVCRDVLGHCPDVRCLLLTGHSDDEALVAAIVAGAGGFISKPIRAPELQGAIRQLAAEDSLMDPSMVTRALEGLRRRAASDARVAALAPPVQDVLGLVVEGQSNFAIMDRLDLTEATVKEHVAAALSALRLI